MTPQGVAAFTNTWGGWTLHPALTRITMPVFKRTRSKVDETDSESDGSPTIGKLSNKRNKSLVNPFATRHKPRNSPQKLAVYIVEAKLGANYSVAGLSKLVKESADHALAENAKEADVLITGIGMRRRLERSIPTELIVSCRYFPCGLRAPTINHLLGPETHRHTRLVGKVDQRG